jgi:cytochrome oxidase assembly protein ShyY1
VLTALFTRRMLTAIAFAVLFAASCSLLARWQWTRFEDKDARARAIETNYRAAPVPLPSVLADTRSILTEEQAWSRVIVSGRYAAGTFYVRGRSLSNTAGMEILVPLQVGAGTLLVDRGWVANGVDAATLPSVPATPDGQVTVVGWLKPSEDGSGKTLPSGQLDSVSVPDAAAQIGGDVYTAYLVLDSETTADGSTPARPTRLETPSTDRGPHFAYTIQWLMTALLGFAFVVFLYRSDPLAAEASPEHPAKPKKVHIWDEEDG